MRHLERAARERKRPMTVVVTRWTRCLGGDSVGWIFHLEPGTIRGSEDRSSLKSMKIPKGGRFFGDILNLGWLHLLCLLLA